MSLSAVPKLCPIADLPTYLSTYQSTYLPTLPTNLSPNQPPNQPFIVYSVLNEFKTAAATKVRRPSYVLFAGQRTGGLLSQKPTKNATSG